MSAAVGKKTADATVTFTFSLIGILLRDYSKGHENNFTFLFPSVIREETPCVTM